ncbi:alpha/beta hydrolase fold domain-containing protein [Natrarchaeobius sp. A-rgal3]|uniref:alpha/beta hydrolase fold domain-containing protein n=1 Tax=Natrarchaeobius versutus TaxID=1679078 RepID=UPI003510067E
MADLRTEDPNPELVPALNPTPLERLVWNVTAVDDDRMLRSRSRIKAVRALRSVLSDEPANLPTVDYVDEFAVAGPGRDVPVRVYVPDGVGETPPCLVYFHGGGWVLGGLDSPEGTLRHLANHVPCVVVSVGYRLAPEHPFPAGVEDCYAATKYVASNPEMFGVDPDRIAVGGRSAGGNLATAVALLARERGGPALVHQVLDVPITDRSFDTDSYSENATGYLLTREKMGWFWRWYLQTDIHDTNPYAAPLRAESLDGLPSATVITAGFDPLRDEGIAYANRLADEGVGVRLHNYPDMIHGFTGEAYGAGLSRSFEALDEIGDRLRSAFADPPS